MNDEFDTVFANIFHDGKYDLPIRWDGNNFPYTVYKILKNYCDDIISHFSNDQQLEDELTIIRNGLYRTIVNAYHGLYPLAYYEFERVMTILDDHVLTVWSPRGNSFYRVVDIRDSAVHDKRQAFHAPFSMRAKIADDRYGISGFPCLYLGSSLEVCCRTIGKKDFDTTLIAARYELTENSFMDGDDIYNSIILIYDLGITPHDILKSYSESDKRHYLRWYLLIAACSFIRFQKDDPYAPEFIIPQLFMQWLRMHISHCVVGVRYRSCMSVSASKIGYNYVFSTNGIPNNVRNNENEFDGKLLRRFKLTDPVFIDDYANLEECETALKTKNTGFILNDIPQKASGIYIIPEGETAVGFFAFRDCQELTSIIIPDTVAYIGNGAFWRCRTLCEVNIPETVSIIEGWAFFCCTSLRKVNIPKAVTKISVAAFNRCRELTSIDIPDSVTMIGSQAFYGCHSLTEVIIPDSVTDIRSMAFGECDNLEIVTMPKNITRIPNALFWKCSNLKKITIPKTVERIEGSAFYECRSLKELSIPDNVTTIGDCAFDNCSGLSEITIPNSVAVIGNGAFNGCTKLNKIAIPNSVTEIGYCAFKNCSNLKKIVIPDSVTAIGGSAFYGCNSLEAIVIPESVTCIGECAFANCPNLAVYCRAQEEPDGWEEGWDCDEELNCDIDVIWGYTGE